MNVRESPLYWSVSCGSWFATQIRISVWFPLILLVFAYRLGAQVGLAFGAIFFLSVLFHEFGHVIGARLTRGSAHEILLWPLGGLAMVQPAPTLTSHLVSTLAGPFVNLLFCGASLPAVLRSGALSEALNPFQFPTVDLQGDPLQAVLVLVFTANWIQLLVNLIPVFPLDGGRVVHTLLTHVWGREGAAEWYLLIGFIAAFGLMFSGLLVDSTWLTSIGAVVLVLNWQESVQHRLGEAYDDTFAGYDFSQGYLSLERSSETVQAEPRSAGWLARWKEKRRLAKEIREREQAEAIERQVDELLNKVHERGIESLTSSERALLEKAGQRYRQKGQR